MLIKTKKKIFNIWLEGKEFLFYIREALFDIRDINEEKKYKLVSIRPCLLFFWYLDSDKKER